MDKMKMRYILSLMAVMLPAQIALSVSLQGVVKSAEGNEISGALITLNTKGGLYSETVYSDSRGHFRMESGQSGQLQLRARKALFADLTLDIEGDQKVAITLQSLTSAKDLSAQLSASAHYARIRFDNPRDQKYFQVDCVSCHQLGNSFTSTPRSLEQWNVTLTRMLGFWGVTDKKWIAKYSSVMAKAFDGKLTSATQTHVVEPLAQTARIIERKLPDGVISHDTEYHAADGKLYTVDQGADRIYITDLQTNLTETFNLPEKGIPQGGKFFTLYGDANPLGLSIRYGPHSLQEGPDGHFYTTNAVGGQIGEFDPATRSYVSHDVGGKGMYPHTLRFDKHEQVWFTLAMSNQVGRFSLKDKKMTLIDLPTTSDRPAAPNLMPYGIDINPLDGSVWYGRLFANKIGRIDPETLEVQEYDPPFIGPRRMRFSADGILWIPAFGDGTLVRLDPKTMQYTSYKLPTLADNEVEAPYAVAIHPKTQEVWITSNMSDRVFRFFPEEERFITYPLPTRGSYLRDMVFLPNGQVCSASSPVPPAVTVEGGMQAIVCIEPNDAPVQVGMK